MFLNFSKSRLFAIPAAFSLILGGCNLREFASADGTKLTIPLKSIIGGGVEGTVFTVVDDNDPGWTYSPEFYSYAWDAEFDGTAHGCEAARGTAEYTFDGTGLELWGWKGPKGGTLEVVLDGGSRGALDLFNADEEVHQTKLFAVSGLTRGLHTVKFVSISEKFIMLDELRIEHEIRL
jgi:hypothetical protein